MSAVTVLAKIEVALVWGPARPASGGSPWNNTTLSKSKWHAQERLGVAIEKKDGVYEVNGMTFGTAEEAYAFEQRLQDARQLAAPLPSPERVIKSRRQHRPKPTALVVLVGALACGIAIAGTLYASPFWTAHQMRRAIAAGDLASFTRYVDQPAISAGLRTSLMSLADSASPRAGGALTNAPVDAVMVDQLAVALSAPARVMEMMMTGRFTVAAPPTRVMGGRGSAPDYSVEYVEFSRVRLRFRDGALGLFELRRENVFEWKLTRIELPL